MFIKPLIQQVLLSVYKALSYCLFKTKMVPWFLTDRATCRQMHLKQHENIQKVHKEQSSNSNYRRDDSLHFLTFTVYILFCDIKGRCFAIQQTFIRSSFYHHDIYKNFHYFCLFSYLASPSISAVRNPIIRCLVYITTFLSSGKEVQ